MDNVIISPGRLNGEVIIPPSKSAAHRNIICAALADGVSRVSPLCHSDDIDATINGMRALGAEISEENGSFVIRGISEKSLPKTHVTIDCGESGSTLRFLLPVAAALGVNTTFIGKGRLPNRPIDELTSVLSSNGVLCSGNHLPLTISGRLTSGCYSISGNISSQYLTGLLLALPLVKNSKIKLSTNLESAGYVSMTMSIMKEFGVTVINEGNVFSSFGEYRFASSFIESDWSQACFYMTACALGADISLLGLNINSVQGDSAAPKIYKKFGAEFEFKNNRLVLSSFDLIAADIDCTDIPDMVPSLAVLASVAKGKSLFYGAKRLRLKESDRILSTVSGLKALGIKAEETDDGMIVYGSNEFPQGNTIIQGFNDHRIVMAFSILSSFAKNPVTITDAGAINKSYPGFFEDFKSLGGCVDVITNR